MHLIVVPRNNNCCHKCGRQVPDSNSAPLFDSYYKKDPTMYILGASCHLLPVVEDGLIICEGSPSRSQYLEGQPRDTRERFAYRADREAARRHAYDQMQLECLAADDSIDR